MKGEAIITVKNKDGIIKKQIKEKNVVFDIPKELLKQMLGFVDFGSLGGQPTSYSGSGGASCINFALDLKDWFSSIKINDEECSTTDYMDFKMPVLYGGEIQSAQTSRSRYAYIDTGSSTTTNNVMRKVWTFNHCPSFMLRSINLCHKQMQKDCTRSAIGQVFVGNRWYSLLNCGKFFFKNPNQANDGNALGIGNNVLGEKGDFKWTYDYGRRGVNKVIQVATSATSYGWRLQAIYPLANDEIALLRYVDNITSDDSESGARFLHIIDANTGALKRSFPLTQFDGFVGSGSYHYISLTIVRIVATPFGNFIVMSKDNNGQNVFIWKIPEQSEMTNYSNNEPIPVYADLTGTGFVMSNSIYTTPTVLNEFLFLPGATYTTDKTVRINNDPLNPFTVYDYIPFNNSTSYGSDSLYGGIFNRYYKNAFNMWDCWYNTTSLNLATPIEIASEDTLTVEYTITAN